MSAEGVVVVGAGVAGTAAAWMLGRSGTRVRVVHDRAGSSALYSGALDDTEPEALDEDGLAFAEALGLWNVGPKMLATREGVVRAASGADRAQLDLGPLAGKHVAVADVARDDWDAPLLVGALSTSAWATRTSTRFSLVAVDALRRGHERRITGHDFAELHDAPERLDALARLLGAARSGHDAWLLGPWLGTLPETSSRLRRSLAVPVGETTSFVGGAAGARFEKARDALFQANAINVGRGRVSAIEARGEHWVVRYDDAGGGRDGELGARAVVIATGGVAAGGIAFVWDPERGAHGFRLPYDAPVALALDGEPGDSGGSLYGASLETRGLGVLERVGIHAAVTGGVLDGDSTAGGLYVAGDAVAARSRTVREAVRSGIRAARAAVLKARG